MLLESWSDKVSVIWDFSLGPVTFIANTMLIVIILKYTPASTKTYSSIILTITIADCASSVGSFMTSVRLIPRGPQLFMIFRGACIYCFTNDIETRSKFCLYWYSFQIQFYILNHFVLIFSYIFRMLTITNPMKQVIKRKVVYIGLFSYSSFHFCYCNWVCYKAFQPMEVINRAISKYEPAIIESGATYNGIVDLSDPSQVVFMVLSIISSSFVIVVAVFCQWRITRFSKKYQYSESVKELHRSLEMVFFAQTIGPILSFITSMLYIISNQEGSSTHTSILLENLMTRPIVLMYIVNPAVTFFYIAPYRRALQKWFGVSRSTTVRHAVSFNTTNPSQQTTIGFVQ
ncbi:unnamed protein product [Caenorhabditis brenneri]